MNTVGIARMPLGGGYRLASSDGGVFAFRSRLHPGKSAIHVSVGAGRTGAGT
jgi:hypothetical protein